MLWTPISPGDLRLAVPPQRTTPKQDYSTTPEWKALRERVLARDNFRCSFCSFRARNYQIVTHLNGVPDDHRMENLTTTCQACNCIVHCGFASAKGWLTLIKTPMSQTAIVTMCRDAARQATYGLRDVAPMAMLELAGHEEVAILNGQVLSKPKLGGWLVERSLASYANVLLDSGNVAPDWGKDLKGLFRAKFDRWQIEFEF